MNDLITSFFMILAFPFLLILSFIAYIILFLYLMIRLYKEVVRELDEKDRRFTS